MTPPWDTAGAEVIPLKLKYDLVATGAAAAGWVIAPTPATEKQFGKGSSEKAARKRQPGKGNREKATRKRQPGKGSEDPANAQSKVIFFLIAARSSGRC
jgi:hypothetical protein